MILLCGLTEWETNVASRGRGKGNTVISRQVVAADNWNFVIGIQRKKEGIKDEDCPITGESFYPCMRMVMPAVGLDGTQRICAALTKLTGETLPTPTDDLAVFGKQIDEKLGTSYFSFHGNAKPDVIERIFKQDDAGE
jgi:hypothetical protein